MIERMIKRVPRPSIRPNPRGIRRGEKRIRQTERQAFRLHYSMVTMMQPLKKPQSKYSITKVVKIKYIIGKNRRKRSEQKVTLHLLRILSPDSFKIPQKGFIIECRSLYICIPQIQHQLQLHLPQTIEGQPPFFSTGALHFGQQLKPLPKFKSLYNFAVFSSQEVPLWSRALQKKQISFEHS